MFGQYKKRGIIINGSTKNFNAEKEGKIWTFLLENDVIAEIHCSLPDSDQHRQPVLGDIYIGKVKNIAANIGAAFIEIAPGKECYYDLSQAPQAIFTHKIGKNRFVSETSWSFRSAGKQSRQKRRLSAAISILPGGMQY